MHNRPGSSEHALGSEFRSWVQEAMQCVKDFSHRLYTAYERYARDAAETWLTEIDSDLVRQVSAETELNTSVLHPFQSSTWPVG